MAHMVDFVQHSLNHSRNSVAAAVAAQEAARLQHEAASFHVEACRELQNISHVLCKAGSAAGVLILFPL